MKASIIIATIRDPVGLFWELEYIKNQTYPVNQVLISDGFYDQNHQKIVEWSIKTGIKVIHLPEEKPAVNISPCQSSARNSLLKYVDSDICIFLDDWHVIPDNFVEKHVAMNKLGYAGLVRWVHTKYLPMKRYSEFEKSVIDSGIPDEEYFCNQAIHWGDMGGARFYDRSKLKEYQSMYIEDDRILEMHKMGLDPSLGIIVDLPADWFWTNSSSAPLGYILKVGGFDENFNGGSGLEDVDLGERMAKIGLKFAFDASITVYHIDHCDTHNIPVRKPFYDICSFHDRRPFLRDETLSRYGSVEMFDDNGLKRCRCVVCGWQGLLNSQQYLQYKKMSDNSFFVPLTTYYGEKHSDILIDRLSEHSDYLERKKYA